MTEWPYDRSTGPDRTLPSWGASLLAAPNTAPSAFPAGSLSEYYHINSGGRFALTGYVYPKVYIPANDPGWYKDNPGGFPNGGVRLSHEILTYVNANREGIPLSDASIFDLYTNGTNTLTPDDRFDMIIMVFRDNATCSYGIGPCGNGITSLGSEGGPSSNGFLSSPLSFGSLEVRDNLYSGSGVWAVGPSRAFAVGTTAHEIGHRQFELVHEDMNALSIMRGNVYHPIMFTATDRMQLDWVLTDEVQYSALTASPTARTLGESFVSDRALVVRNGPSNADLVVEARTQSSNVWDIPASTYGLYQDDDIYAQYLPEDALLVYKRWTDYPGFFAVSMSNAGLSTVASPFRSGFRFGFVAGQPYTPLTRIRYDFQGFPEDPTLDRSFAITDISRSGTTFSFSLWRDYLTAPVVKSLGVNYTLANHVAGSFTFPSPLVGVPYEADRNVARTDDVTLGGTVRLTDGLSQVIVGDPTLTLLPGAVLEVPANTTSTLQGPAHPSRPVVTYQVMAGDGARIDIVGRLIADNVAFTSVNARTGWGGLRFGPLSGTGGRDVQPLFPSALTGVSISGVGYEPLIHAPYPPRAAVEVQNRTVTINGGTTISGSVYANGLLATGTNADVTVSGAATQIVTNEGLGVLATAGAKVLVTDGADVLLNDLGGLQAVGYGTRATVTGYASVDGNLGLGILAESQAHATVRSPAGTGNTSISGNDGGPTGRAGGSVDGGQCEPAGATGRANSFLLNYNNGTNLWDASSRGGSAVVGRYAFWGTSRTATSLLLDTDGSSTINVSPTAAGPGTPDPTCPAIFEGRATEAGTRSEIAARNERSDDRITRSPAVAGRGGTPSAAVVALATAAREAAWAGDVDGAFVTLAAAADSVVTDDDRAAVFEATAALLAGAQPFATVAALEASASGTGPDAPWAARALAVAYAESGQTASAETVAASLTATDGGHAAFGHALLVRLAVEADSAAYALDRLADFAASVADTDTLAAEAFGSAIALVAVSFPDADLSAMSGGAAGRGFAGRGTTDATASPLLSAARTEAAVDELSVWPNPAAGRGTVRISVSTPARSATISMYDALGRRVAVLHDGALAAGPHDLGFEASALAPSTYVVVARVTAEGGRVWTEVRRVTVAR